MKNDAIKTIIMLGLTLLIPIVVLIAYIVKDGIEHGYVDKKEIIRDFENNEEVFQELANYMQVNPKDVSINKDEQNKFTIFPTIDENSSKEFNIDSKKLSEDIIYCFYKLEFKDIYEEHNTIYFIRQSNIKFDQGIIFLESDEKPTYSITDLEHLVGNWYYYESD